MKRYLVALVLGCLTLGVTAQAEEHVVTAHQGTMASQWVYGGRRSMVTGEEPKPGKDGPWRLRVKVKNGDYVLFTDSTVVFENGKDEAEKVWTITEFLDGSKGKYGPLTDPKQKAYYLNPDKALLTEELTKEGGRAFFLIKITNLTADKPILFASGEITHLDKGKGNKHFMFGAIELDTTSR